MRVRLCAGALAVALCATAHAATLASQATIRRDTFGVPHILAETEEAAAYAMGYAQAEDHCVEIARRFISARGEEAKYFGSGVETDFRTRRYGIYTVAKASLPKLDPVLQAMMRAYADGLNRYVAQHRQELPAWIPTFDAIDVVAQGRAQITRFAFPNAAIQAIQRKYPPGPVAAAPRQPEPWGSNMWAIAPSRTTSGKAILLGNPHQPWAALYWEAQVTVPGKINFFGGTFVGSPVLTTGFNLNLGWTHTVNFPDLDDIYMLKLDPRRPNHYIFDGASRPLSKTEIAVEVRQPDGSLKTERREYWDSHLGPIVHRTADKVFALKSATLDASGYAEEWYALSKSKNWREFYSNLKRNALPMFNLAYADAEGNIFYIWNGTVPKRLDDGTDYRFEVPGDTSKYVWREFHPTGELPQLRNPSGGYVQNCNGPPWFTCLRNLLDPKKYPSYFEPGRQITLRTEMSLRMLESQEKFSLADVQRLKYNTRMLLADLVKPELVTALREALHPSEDLKRGLAVLEAWDNNVARDSRGAVLFQRFWDTYLKANSQPFAEAWDLKRPYSTPRGLSKPDLALRHLEEAVRWTRKTYSAPDVAWGEVHRIRLGALDLPADGAGGEYGLFHNVGFAETASGKRIIGTVDAGKPFAGGGDGWFMTIEFSRPLNAWSLLAYGETANPASRHSTDQAPLFAEHRFKRVWFTEPEIQAHLERSYHPGE